MRQIDSKEIQFIADAKERFKKAMEFERENRTLAAEDLLFLAGEQWPEEIKRQREIENRPCLTVNKLPASVAQAVGDARMNKPAIKVRPDEDGDVDQADVLEGLIRNIESRSSAGTAYMTAYEHSVSCGFGHWRILTEYAADDAFHQDIRIRRIKNPFSVVWDPDASDPTRMDAMWCFVYEGISKERFEETWPDAAPNSWTDETYAMEMSDWKQGDEIRVAEYWCKKPKKKYLMLTSDGKVLDGTDLMEEFDYTVEQLERLPEVDKVREVDGFVVEMTKMCGSCILEKTSSWAGAHIPVISCYGPEEVTEERVSYKSLVRYAKDPQKMYNFWTSQITEKIALAPKSPYVGTTKMFAKHKRLWDNANTSNRAYLPYTPDPEAAGMKPQRERPADLNIAEIEQRNQASDDIKATTGIYDASLGNRSNETSGKAILARDRAGDVGTFPWMDNLTRAIEWTGVILLDLIPKIYDSKRIVRVLGEDGQTKDIPINQPFVKKDGTNKIMLHDLAKGKYDCTISVGPSYTTQRVEAAESMMAFANAFPDTAPMIGDLIAKAMDWQYSDEIAERLRSNLPPEMRDLDEMEPEEREALEQAAQAAKQEQEQIKQLAMKKEMTEIAATEAKAKRDNAEADAQLIENALVQSGAQELLSGQVSR